VRWRRAVASRMVRKHFKQSCAVGTAALHISAEEEQQLRALCQQALTRWAQTAARCMPELSAKQRAPAARFVAQLLEGAQLTARAWGSRDPLDEAARAFALCLKGCQQTTAP
jgi:hypothetical protein